MKKITIIWGTEAVKGIDKPEEGYTWVQGMTLDEAVERAEQAEADAPKKPKESKRSWQQVLVEDGEDEDAEDQACLMCSL